MNHETLPAQGPVDVEVRGEPQEVAIRVTQQGAVRVNAAHLYRLAEGIAAVYVDLHSKRAELACTGSGDNEPPDVTLLANDETLHLDETQPRDSPTTFEFPEYVGWRVFAADGPRRYTMAICLVAPDAPAALSMDLLAVFDERKRNATDH